MPPFERQHPFSLQPRAIRRRVDQRSLGGLDDASRRRSSPRWRATISLQGNVTKIDIGIVGYKAHAIAVAAE
jgi:hypothetical protein